MDVDIKLNPRNPSKIAKDVSKSIDRSKKRAMSRTVQHGVFIIESRTEKGYGYKGKFAPYTPEYRQAKANAGKLAGAVNLSFTGQMLGSLTQRVNSKTRGTIFFRGGANSRKAAMNDKSRPFFGFNRGEEKELRNVYARFIRTGK